jgi:hypothetical protein
MTSKTARNPYNPVIDAERKILPANQAEFESQRGTSKIQRVGEQFYMTCVCGAAEVTSDIYRPTKFWEDHRGH